MAFLPPLAAAGLFAGFGASTALLSPQPIQPRSGAQRPRACTLQTTQLRRHDVQRTRTEGSGSARGEPHMERSLCRSVRATLARRARRAARPRRSGGSPSAHRRRSVHNNMFTAPPAPRGRRVPRSVFPPPPPLAWAPHTQLRGVMHASSRSASREPGAGFWSYSQRAVSGSDMRMDSMRPPVLRPNVVPRSYTRLNST